MGRGRKDEVQSTKDEKEWSAECGIEGVVSGQSSFISRVLSGDPQGSTFQLRNADFRMRNRERITNHESRITNHDSRTPRTFSGRTKPFRRKTKAAIKTGRALPHVADGSARPGSRVLSSLGQGSRLNNRSARNGVLANPKSAIRDAQSDQLLSSLSALSSRVSMLKGLLM